MGSAKGWDLAHQTANIARALFQVGVTFAASAAIRRLGALGDGTRTRPNVAV
jgi:kynureninase